MFQLSITIKQQFWVSTFRNKLALTSNRYQLAPPFAIGAFLTFTPPSSPQYRDKRCWHKRDCDRARHHHLREVYRGRMDHNPGPPLCLPATSAAEALLCRARRATASGHPACLDHIDPPLVLIVAETWNRMTNRALQFGLRISPDAMAIHIRKLTGPDIHQRRQALRRRWAEDVQLPARKAGSKPPQLVLLEAHYRRTPDQILTQNATAPTAPSRNRSCIGRQRVLAPTLDHLTRPDQRRLKARLENFKPRCFPKLPALW
jgi:hypothetical protein